MNINEHKVQPAVTFTSQQSLGINVTTLTHRREKLLFDAYLCVCECVL